MTTSRVYMNRPTPPPPYEDRWAYLTTKAPNDRHLCHVAAAQDESRQPWITVVLGSGCTTSTEQVQALCSTAAALESAVARAFPQGEICDEPYSDIVKRFADDLLVDRLRLKGPQTTDAAGTAAEDVPDWMAGLFVAAALLTKLYHQVKFLSNNAPRRADHEDEALLEKASNTSWNELVQHYAIPAHKILFGLERSAETIAKRLNEGLGLEDHETATDPDRLTKTITALMHRLSARVSIAGDRALRIGLLDVQSLAEFAWFCLTTIGSSSGKPPANASTVYPGWTDLLLDLSNYDPPDGRVGMPLFESMAAAQNIIQARYDRITRLSWAKPHGNHEFYEAVSELLGAQESFYEARRLHRTQPPLPTAFVTSFDVELELALLRSGQPFSVALPVHVVNVAVEPAVAHSCWIALRVNPIAAAGDDEKLKLLMEPDESQLSLLEESREDQPSGQKTREPAQEGGPFVVRLSGCPLIRLPDLRSAPKLRKAVAERFENSLNEEAMWGAPAGDEADEWIEDRRAQIEKLLAWQHAVLINEHDAMLQNESDLIPSLASGLPKEMASDHRGWSRFWMLLGVQIRDSAVRQRIATLVSSIPRIKSGSGTKIQRTGVAVNAYIAELEQDLLFWNGFDVVCEPDLAEFGDDLSHIASHLKSANYECVPADVRKCNV